MCRCRRRQQSSNNYGVPCLEPVRCWSAEARWKVKNHCFSVPSRIFLPITLERCCCSRRAIHSGLMKSNVFCVRSKYLFGGDRSGQGGRFAEEFCLSIPSGNSRRFMRSLTSLLWAAASSRAEGTTLLSLRSMESPLSWVITQRIFEILWACFNRETRCESRSEEHT